MHLTLMYCLCLYSENVNKYSNETNSQTTVSLQNQTYPHTLRSLLMPRSGARADASEPWAILLRTESYLHNSNPPHGLGKEFTSTQRENRESGTKEHFL